MSRNDSTPESLLRIFRQLPSDDLPLVKGAYCIDLEYLCQMLKVDENVFLTNLKKHRDTLSLKSDIGKAVDAISLYGFDNAHTGDNTRLRIPLNCEEKHSKTDGFVLNMKVSEGVFDEELLTQDEERIGLLGISSNSSTQGYNSTNNNPNNLAVDNASESAPRHRRSVDLEALSQRRCDSVIFLCRHKAQQHPAPCMPGDGLASVELGLGLGKILEVDDVIINLPSESLRAQGSKIVFMPYSKNEFGRSDGMVSGSSEAYQLSLTDTPLNDIMVFAIPGLYRHHKKNSGYLSQLFSSLVLVSFESFGKSTDFRLFTHLHLKNRSIVCFFMILSAISYFFTAFFSENIIFSGVSGNLVMLWYCQICTIVATLMFVIQLCLDFKKKYTFRNPLTLESISYICLLTLGFCTWFGSLAIGWSLMSSSDLFHVAFVLVHSPFFVLGFLNIHNLPWRSRILCATAFIAGASSLVLLIYPFRRSDPNLTFSILCCVSAFGNVGFCFCLYSQKWLFKRLPITHYMLPAVLVNLGFNFILCKYLSHLTFEWNRDPVIGFYGWLTFKRLSFTLTSCTSALFYVTFYSFWLRGLTFVASASLMALPAAIVWLSYSIIGLQEGHDILYKCLGFILFTLAIILYFMANYRKRITFNVNDAIELLPRISLTDIVM